MTTAAATTTVPGADYAAALAIAYLTLIIPMTLQDNSSERPYNRRYE